jgi:DpnII restriction endonuclease
MQVIQQSLDDLVASLTPLAVEWMDEIAANAIARLTAIPVRDSYSRSDIAALLEGDFEEGMLCCRLFLALSKDTMEGALREQLGRGGIGLRRYQADREAFLDTLERLGLPDAMTTTINYVPIWSDILVERLRSGRGSAIQGQRRGRGLEDFAEALVREVFGDAYEARCTFTGAAGKTAKCDLVIPARTQPRIIIEVKGYGATGSKMSDIIGDLDAITESKRRDTALLFVTDGMTWKARLSDLRRIVRRQNDGNITRIYTTKMRETFLDDLRTLKAEYGL